MPGVIGKPRSYHKKFKFVFEMDEINSARFQKCSELKAEIAVIEQYEGGDILPEKEAGRMKVSDITLERGATGDLDLWNWFDQTASMISETGLVDPEYKRDGDLVQLDRDGTERRRWSCKQAFMKSFSAGSWDNDADENVIETCELAMHHFELALNI